MIFPYRVQTSTVQETENIGRLFSEYLANENIHDAFSAFYGDLGAGKTAFVRGMASVLVPNAFVCSPTYSIVNSYVGKDFRINHFDLYRIETEDDLESIGFYDYSSGITVAEWSEKIPYALPDSYYRISIEKIDDTNRLITIEKKGEENS